MVELSKSEIVMKITQDIPEEDLDMLSKALFGKEYDNIDDMSIEDYLKGEDNGRK